MPSKLVHLLIVAACCSSSSGFGPTSTLVSRIRLDLDFEQTTSLPSITESPGGVCVSENMASLPPVIRSIADERREFQMNLGKAMDTLRKDMPYILKRAPGMFFVNRQFRPYVFYVFWILMVYTPLFVRL